MDGDIPDNMHPGSGSAVIVSPNMAIWKGENNYEVLFWLNEGVITLGYQDISGDKAREKSLVSGVSFEDEYTKNGPKFLYITN